MLIITILIICIRVITIVIILIVIVRLGRRGNLQEVFNSASNADEQTDGQTDE
jgi:hypothetical protein